MKKEILFLFIAIFSYGINAQNTYEKGYYIDNTGKKTDCLIKNLDWKKNPREFKYKLSENADINNTSIAFVKEFGILGISKYIRFHGNIEISSDKTSEISNTKYPIFKKEKLFLKVLVEGKANLYVYYDSNLTRYFYKTENSSIEQLVYKKYLDESTKYRIRENIKYKQQLWENLKCHSISKKEINDLKYFEKELTNLFVKYSECYDIEFTKPTKERKVLLNLNIRPGVNVSSLVFDNPHSNRYGGKTEPKKTFRLGIEAEVIFPFNNNKWSFILEPSYQYLYVETSEVFHLENPTHTIENNVETDYKSIDIPLGIRYYHFLDKKSKLFINASYLFSISNNSIIEIRQDNSLYSIPDISFLKIGYRTNFVFGLGYNYNNKLSLELRYGLNGDILSYYAHWDSDYQQSSIIIGYNLF